MRHKGRHRQRCILGMQKLFLSRTKTFVITGVSPKYSRKYSINIPLPAFETDTWDVHNETLRTGLRRIRQTVAASVTYFCRCLSLMKVGL